MTLVLWGGRKDDLQYNSRAFWRLNIPIDPTVSVLHVRSSHLFDVGNVVDIGALATCTVVGLDGQLMGVREKAA